TRFSRDWSSDVCSSDLLARDRAEAGHGGGQCLHHVLDAAGQAGGIGLDLLQQALPRRAALALRDMPGGGLCLGPTVWLGACLASSGERRVGRGGGPRGW